jgi:hypothetical protein
MCVCATGLIDDVRREEQTAVGRARSPRKGRRAGSPIRRATAAAPAPFGSPARGLLADIERDLQSASSAGSGTAGAAGAADSAKFNHSAILEQNFERRLGAIDLKISRLEQRISDDAARARLSEADLHSIVASATPVAPAAGPTGASAAIAGGGVDPVRLSFEDVKGGGAVTIAPTTAAPRAGAVPIIGGGAASSDLKGVAPPTGSGNALPSLRLSAPPADCLL